MRFHHADFPTASALGPDEGFAHDALVYSSDDDYVHAVVPFICDGLELGESVSVVTTPHNISLLREALGADAESVAFAPHTETGLTPARKVALLDGLGSARPDDGQRSRVVGEALFGSTTREQLEWVRYEAILNDVFAAAPQSFLCAYDRRQLPEWVIESAVRTHPHLRGRGKRARSDAYTDPAEFARECAQHLMPAPRCDTDEPVRDISIDRRELAKARALLTELVGALCADPDRASEIVVGLNEVVTNALQHGSDQVRVSCWRDPGRLVCEVTDNGPGFDDSLAGFRPLAPGQLGGRGLWLARQTLDTVEFACEPTGVRAHLAIDV